MTTRNKYAPYKCRCGDGWVVYYWEDTSAREGGAGYWVESNIVTYDRANEFLAALREFSDE